MWHWLAKLFNQRIQRDPDLDTDAASNEIWCVVANIKREISYGPGGEETKIGTRQFRVVQRSTFQVVFRGCAIQLFALDCIVSRAE